MHKISTDLLKNNANYLKSCILYEVLSEKPIFDCFRHFCKRNGEDAMSYNDFEYYYYRFYSGDVDFEHERRIDSTEKTLSELPLEMLGMITGYLEPVERAHLRSMSRKFRAADETEVLYHNQVRVKYTPSSLVLHVDEKKFSYDIDEENGEFVGKSPIDPFNCFAQTLRHPKLQMEALILHLSSQVPLEKREKLLECLPPSLHVKIVLIDASPNETFKIVSSLKQGALERIAVMGCPVKLADVFETEQFKQAKYTNVGCEKVRTKDIPNFYNLRNFHIQVTSLTLNQFKNLWDNLAKNPAFQLCRVKATVFRRSELAAGLGLHGHENLNEKGNIIYRHPIPDSLGFLEIEIKNDGLLIRRNN
ncbi:hypothetical protein CRE_15688 [Caenorhabditis remanei]|uniref:F-box domain-containing protein n=1 Tax=Caenorhabditis remanei TaxID=31234 RepID=E3N872_CAERE|nr:hypothetical protein CRE_15688 [Caenorhabditis remanei]